MSHLMFSKFVTVDDNCMCIYRYLGCRQASRPENICGMNAACIGKLSPPNVHAAISRWSSHVISCPMLEVIGQLHMRIFILWHPDVANERYMCLPEIASNNPSILMHFKGKEDHAFACSSTHYLRDNMSHPLTANQCFHRSPHRL